MKKYNSKSVVLIAVLSLFTGSEVLASKSPLMGNGKHNSKAPIEVTSDALEVLQAENKAVFTGHVVAIQGDVRLTADKMTVFYASAEEKRTDSKSDKKKPEKNNKSADANQGAIKKIVPEGNVFLATPEETASGANGVYDVEHQEIHLNDHITLTRGKNILKGDKLVYNFATGKSIVTSGGASSQAGGKGKERVHALFVPEDKKTTDAKKKAQKSDDQQDQSNQ